MSKKKEGPKKGSDVEEEDPKHLNRDPRTKVLIKQRKARKSRNVNNLELTKNQERKKSKVRKVRKGRKGSKS